MMNKCSFIIARILHLKYTNPNFYQNIHCHWLGYFQIIPWKWSHISNIKEINQNKNESIELKWQIFYFISRICFRYLGLGHFSVVFDQFFWHQAPCQNHHIWPYSGAIWCSSLRCSWNLTGSKRAWCSNRIFAFCLSLFQCMKFVNSTIVTNYHMHLTIGKTMFILQLIFNSTPQISKFCQWTCTLSQVIFW